MSRFIEVLHEEWIAAAPEVVRAHYADLQHRQQRRVHPGEQLRLLAPGPHGPRYERLRFRGLRTERDLFERHLAPDGSVVDTVVAGSNWGRAISVRFWRRPENLLAGTLVEFKVTQPLPAVIGRLLARWLRRRLERELRLAAGEARADIEQGYKTDRRLRAA